MHQAMGSYSIRSEKRSGGAIGGVHRDLWRASFISRRGIVILKVVVQKPQDRSSLG